MIADAGEWVGIWQLSFIVQPFTIVSPQIFDLKN